MIGCESLQKQKIAVKTIIDPGIVVGKQGPPNVGKPSKSVIIGQKISQRLDKFS